MAAVAVVPGMIFGLGYSTSSGSISSKEMQGVPVNMTALVNPPAILDRAIGYEKDPHTDLKVEASVFNPQSFSVTGTDPTGSILPIGIVTDEHGKMTMTYAAGVDAPNGHYVFKIHLQRGANTSDLSLQAVLTNHYIPHTPPVSSFPS